MQEPRTIVGTLQPTMQVKPSDLANPSLTSSRLLIVAPWLATLRRNVWQESCWRQPENSELSLPPRKGFGAVSCSALWPSLLTLLPNICLYSVITIKTNEVLKKFTNTQYGNRWKRDELIWPPVRISSCSYLVVLMGKKNLIVVGGSRPLQLA